MRRISGVKAAPVIFSVCFAIVLASCKNETVSVPGEYISTLKVVAKNQHNSIVDTFEYVNFNETRPNPPSYVDTIRLQANSSYAIRLILLNEAANPVQEMTDTIVARAADQLMVYNIDPAQALFSLNIGDKDENGLPLGLQSVWKTADSTNGWLRLILREQQGHKNGTETPGITAFEADFPVTVR